MNSKKPIPTETVVMSEIICSNIFDNSNSKESINQDDQGQMAAAKDQAKKTQADQKYSLSSHQLFQKQKLLAGGKKEEKPTQSTLLQKNSIQKLLGKAEKGNSLSMANFQHLVKKQPGLGFSQTQTRPMAAAAVGEAIMVQSYKNQGQRSQSRGAHDGQNKNIDKIIKKNLKKQKVKEEQAQHQILARLEKDKVRKRDLQIQNDLVRQNNREKTAKSQMRKNQINTSSASAHNLKYFKQKSVAQQSKGQLNKAIDLTLAMRATDQRKTNVSVLQNQGSQERGSQRMISTVSGKSRASASKSGHTGLVHGQSSFAGGGKKDSINSNISYNNLQQSQSTHQGGARALQSSQRLEGSALAGVRLATGQLYHRNEEEIMEQEQSQEESNRDDPAQLELKHLLRGMSASSVDINLKRLEEELNMVSYNNTKNISQLLKEEEIQLGREGLQGLLAMRKEGGLNGLSIHNQTLSQGSLVVNNKLGLKNRQKSLAEQSQVKQFKQTGVPSFGAGHTLGLDFLDVKKEIKNELRQVDKKAIQKYAKNQRKKSEMQQQNGYGNNTMVIINDSSVQDLRAQSLIGNLNMDNYNHNIRSKSGSPQIETSRQLQDKIPNTNQKRLRNKIGAQNTLLNFSHNQFEGLTNNQSDMSIKNLHALFLNKSSSVEGIPSEDKLSRKPPTSSKSLFKKKNLGNYSMAQMQEMQNSSAQINIRKQNSIRKFIKTKQKELNQLQVKEKIEEITKAIKVSENLERLDTYAKKQFKDNSQEHRKDPPVQLRSKSRGAEKQKKTSLNRETNKFQNQKQNVENTSFNVNIFNKFSKDSASNLNVQSAGNLNQVIFNIQKGQLNMDSTSEILRKHSIKNNQTLKEYQNFGNAPNREGVVSSQTSFIDSTLDQPFENQQLSTQIRKDHQKGSNKRANASSQEKLRTLDYQKNTGALNDNQKRKKPPHQLSQRGYVALRTRLPENLFYDKRDNSGKRSNSNNVAKRYSRSRERDQGKSKNSLSKSKSQERTINANGILERFSSSAGGSSKSRQRQDQNMGRKSSNSRSKQIRNSKHYRNLRYNNKKEIQSLSPEQSDLKNEKKKSQTKNDLDFDVKRFMHGTIKISPKENKLSQYLRTSKSGKRTNSKTSNSRARNHTAISLAQGASLRQNIMESSQPLYTRNAGVVYHKTQQNPSTANSKRPKTVQKSQKVLQKSTDGRAEAKMINSKLPPRAVQTKREGQLQGEARRHYQVVMPTTALEQDPHWAQGQETFDQRSVDGVVVVQDSQEASGDRKKQQKSKRKLVPSKEGLKLNPYKQKSLSKSQVKNLNVLINQQQTKTKQQKKANQKQITQNKVKRFNQSPYKSSTSASKSKSAQKSNSKSLSKSKSRSKNSNSKSRSRSREKGEQQIQLLNKRSALEIQAQASRKNLMKQEQLQQILKKINYDYMKGTTQAKQEQKKKVFQQKPQEQRQYKQSKVDKINIAVASPVRNTDQRDIVIQNQASSAQGSAKKKVERYSEEKWVNVKEPIADSQQKASLGQFSIHKSLNNFTFLEKQTSKKGQEASSNAMMSSHDPETQQKLQKLYLNNIDAEMSSHNSSVRFGLPAKASSRIEQARILAIPGLTLEALNVIEGQRLQNGGVSCRSGRSGIMAQLNEHANAGELRTDNEQFYPQLLNNLNQPPYSAIDTYRSITSNKVIPVHGQHNQKLIMNQELVGQDDEYAMGSSTEMAIKVLNSKQPAQSKYQTETGLGSQPIQKSKQEPYHLELSQKPYQLATQFTVENSSSQIQTNSNMKSNLIQKISKIDIEEQVHEAFGQSSRQDQSRYSQGKNLNNLDELNIQKVDQINDEESNPVLHFSGHQTGGDSEQTVNVEESNDGVASQKISEINYDKTLESRSNIEGQQSDPDELCKQIRELQDGISQPQSLMSLNSHKSNDDTKRNAEDSKESNQQLMQDLQTYQKQPEGEDMALSQELQEENGHATLISHLYDPSNEAIANDDDEKKDKPATKSIVLEPIEENIKGSEQNSQQRPLDDESTQQLKAENLLKYLDDKWKEKKQENNSSLFDHSRASMQSDQKISQNRGSLTSGGKAQTVSEKLKITFNAPADEYEGSHQQDSSDIEFSQKKKLQNLVPRAIKYEVQENWPNTIDEGSAADSNDKVNILAQSEPQSNESETEQNKIIIDHENIHIQLEGQLSDEPAFPATKVGDTSDSQQSPRALLLVSQADSLAQPPSAGPLEPEEQNLGLVQQHSNALDQYLDDHISSENVSPTSKQRTASQQAMIIEDGEVSQLQEVKLLVGQNEMIITSNLTTLNIDGENSSLDGELQENIIAPAASNAELDSQGSDQIEQSKKAMDDQKYLQQFRKKQMLVPSPASQSVAATSFPDNLEQEERPKDSEPESLQSKEKPQQLDDKSKEDSPEKTKNVDLYLAENEPSSNIKISDILKIKKTVKQPERICAQIVSEIVDAVDNYSSTVSSNAYEITAEYMQKQLKRLQNPKNKIEIINPQIIVTTPPQPAENAKVLTVEEYHEALMSLPKIPTERSPVKEVPKSQEASPEKGKSITGGDVYSYLCQSINQTELKSQIKQVVEMKQRQNTENDLIRSDDYVNELCQYLIQFEILDHPEGGSMTQGQEELLQQMGGVNYLTVFLQNLTQPIKKELVDELNKLQTQESGKYDHFESSIDPLKHPILPIDMYLDVEKQREFEYQVAQGNTRPQIQNYATGQSSKSALTFQSSSLQQECQHIFNKSIFDAINESLTKFRPYGVVGEPVPWSIKYRRLQTDVDINSVDTERLFQMVKQEVFRWMSTQEGALTHKQESIFQYIDLNIPLMPAIEEKIEELGPSSAKEPEKSPEKDDKIVKEELKEEPKEKEETQTPKELHELQDGQILKFKKTIVEEATQDMRQAKLASQLHQEIIENEHHWLNYEFEETQIRLDLSDMIFDTLMQETVEFLNSKNSEEPKEEENREMKSEDFD